MIKIKIEKIKKTSIVALFLLLSSFKFASAQDNMLTLLKNKSDIVAHVKILELQGGEIEEVGVEEWSALCKIIQPIKGLVKKDGKIRFRFNKFVFQGKEEPFIVEKSKEYVIFLKGTTGKVRFPSDKKIEIAYDLLDRWVGALPYHYHLVERLIKYIEEK